MKSIAILFALCLVHILRDVDACSGDTCENCMVSGQQCGWCADPNFDDLRFPRCQNFHSSQAVGNCTKRSVIQPNSRILKKKTNAQSGIFKEKKIILALKSGEELTLPLIGEIPASQKKRTNLKIKVIGSKKSQLETEVSSDCKKMKQKQPDSLVCNKLRKGDKVNITVSMMLEGCLGQKHRTKVTVKAKAGRLKQTIHIIVRDTCKCTCKNSKKKSSKRCSYNGKMAIGNCKCTSEKPRSFISKQPLGEVSDIDRDYPPASPNVGCETCDVKKYCTAYGPCVDCLAFFNSPMPRTMCGWYCKRSFPLVTKVIGLSNADALCTFKDRKGCVMKFREVEDGIIEVEAMKECSSDTPKCEADKCMADNGLVCSGHGTCDCGKCICDRDSGFTGDTCNICESCDDECTILKPCVQCMALGDFSHQYNSTQVCNTHCRSYQNRLHVVQYFSDPYITTCKYHDSMRCQVTYKFMRDSNGDLHAEVLNQRVCPEGGWMFN